MYIAVNGGMKMKYNKFQKNLHIRSEKGSSIVFFAIVMVLIFGFTALAVDIGVIVLEKSKLSATIDSAVLAGAQELVVDSSNTENMVNNYIAQNATNLKQVDVIVDMPGRTVEVRGVKTIQNYFARFLGNNMEDITAVAKAKIENIKSLTGARPLAIVNQTFTYGQLYTLKEGASDGTSGNYAAIALGGTGTSVYRDNLLYGYQGTISVGDMIETETGVIAKTTENCINTLIGQCNHTPACTYEYYNKNCSRIIFIPIVNTLEINGRKFVQVLGFGTFFLEGSVNKGGQTDIIGRFITYHMQGETSNEINDYGTYGIKLVK